MKTGMVHIKKLILITSSAVFLFMAPPSGISSTEQIYYFDYENVLGTSFSLKVAAESEEVAIQAENVALKEIDRLAAILSTYDPQSEVSLWQNTLNTDIPVSPELFEVLSLFEQWESKTGGALNASAAVAIALWNEAATNQVLPDSDELMSAMAAMNKKHWELDAAGQTAKHLSTDPLVLNTFVKSYIINEASIEVMKVPGVYASVINIGGDIVIAGDIWESVSVTNPISGAENDKPMSILELNNKAIATSGNYKRGFMIGDEWYSHILDARTAVPAAEIISATVVADRATDAGALATAFNILTPQESQVLAEQIPDVEYLIVTRTGERIASDNWEQLEVTPDQEETNYLAYNQEDTVEGANDFEVDIIFELPRFSGRYQRPYVAVWVENSEMEPVRTLALWFNDNRWLPELRRWYKSNFALTRQSSIMRSITSATRPAGEYSLVWDRRDNQGDLLKSGTYTIYIEAVREHGTYQLIQHEFELNREPKYVELAGGVEISSASIEYHQIESD